MSHFNKHAEIPSIAYHQYLADHRAGENNSRLDLFLTIFIVAIGVAGFCYVFSLPFCNQVTDIYSNNRPMVSTELSAAELSGTTLEKPRYCIHIRGEQIANQALTFVIDHYDKAVQYEIHFGNGRFKRVLNKETDYTYPQTGKFQALLKVQEKGEWKVVDKLNVKIH